MQGTISPPLYSRAKVLHVELLILEVQSTISDVMRDVVDPVALHVVARDVTNEHTLAEDDHPLFRLHLGELVLEETEEVIEVTLSVSQSKVWMFTIASLV